MASEMKINTQILSTAPIDNELLNDALHKGIEIDATSFIQIEPVREKSLARELEDLCKSKITAVFTSANAVNAIADFLNKFRPDWDIYCIGHATRDAVLQYFESPSIKGIANNGEVLAGIIHSHNVPGVVFFCGDKRLDALPNKLYKDGIIVREIVVYKTKETPEQIKKHYQGILFFSPNGVKSFFSVNEVGQFTVLFAIGNTTAKALKAQTNNKVVVSDVPSREEIVNKVIEYFHKQAPKDRVA